MLKKALLSFGLGTHADYLETVLSSFIGYAKRHSYDVVIPHVESEVNTPPSWQKVPEIIEVLKRYDVALWLDADILIVNGAEDICEELNKDESCGVVFHYVDVGIVPNCGVWVLKRAAVPLLENVLALKSKYLNHGWWEQAAFMEVIGMNPAACKLPTSTNSFFSQVCPISPLYNWHRNDTQKVVAPYFAHATTFKDRQRVLDSWKLNGFNPNPVP